jgi:hypothetical protein
MTGTTTKTTKTSWRQLLHFLTGDRHREGAALAETVKATLHPDPEQPASPVEIARIEQAAEQAVVEAHGDSVVADSDSDGAEPELSTADGDELPAASSDVAKPSDVLEQGVRGLQ